MLRTDKIIENEVIQVNRGSELFMAICQVSVHSFIIVGVQDKITGENHVLFSLGQVYTDSGKLCSDIFRTLFTSMGGALGEEVFVYKRFSHDLSYKSFTLTQEQYSEFLSFVTPYRNKSIERRPHAFVLDCDPEKSKMISYRYTELSDQKEEPDVKSSPYSNITISNTCRHSAIRLLSRVFESITERAQDLSSFFLSKFSYKTQIQNGKFKGHIYILPVPPNPKELSKTQYEVLFILYRRLEKIPKDAHDDPITIDKFNQLKILYQSLNSSKKNQSIKSLFTEIVKWEDVNKDLIDKKRDFTLFPTATRDMVDEIKRMTNGQHHSLNLEERIFMFKR